MKFKKKPIIKAGKTDLEKEKLANEILKGADRAASDETYIRGNLEKPWLAFDDGSVKDETVFSFRVPKDDMLKLKYINKITKISINGICLLGVREYLKKEIEKIKQDA